MQSPWYLYRRTNHGVAVGFFANSNHMATLLVVSLAFLAAFVAVLRARVRNEKAGSAVLLLAVAGSLTLIVGITLNGSLAALLLGLPVAAVSVAMFLPQRRRLRFPVAARAGVGRGSGRGLHVAAAGPAGSFERDLVRIPTEILVEQRFGDQTMGCWGAASGPFRPLQDMKTRPRSHAPCQSCPQ
jgi:hypothetical protein